MLFLDHSFLLKAVAFICGTMLKLGKYKSTIVRVYFENNHKSSDFELLMLQTTKEWERKN